MAEVHLVAGLNGAGKTTLARRLQSHLPAVRFSLDEWMLRLYGLRFDDARYPELAVSCRQLIWDLAEQVLRTDASVVLDWNLWSRRLRAEAVQRASAHGADCHLHYLDVPVEVAVERAEARVDDHAHVLGAAEVRHLAALFEPPSADEGFVLHLVR